MRKYSRRNNLVALIIEIVLTIALCLGMALSAIVGLMAETRNFSAEVIADYNTLTNNYIRAFKVLRMEAVNEIAKDPSFDEMNAWLQTKDSEFRDAVGDDVFDGFAFTYKGGYVHSWNYGDYSNYDAATRPWYQIAESNKGDVAIVAPYVTFLSDTDLVDKYDILRMSISQKYNDEISFDFDLTVDEINALLDKRNTVYKGTKVFFYDKDGYILSSTDENYYGHNINKPDEQITNKLSKTLVDRKSGKFGMKLKYVDGKARVIFSKTDEEGKTVCILVPFVEVFTRNLLFVLLLACVLIYIETWFYRRTKRHMEQLEDNKEALNDALHHAEEASHAKGDFMSRMSHEIRTPLNAIIGYLDIAHNDADKEKIEHCIEKSQMASKHLLSIINDVLDVSAIESGRMKIDCADFDVKQMVNALTTLFYAQARAKGINFNVKMEPLDNEWISGDELRVRQILLNLLSNAVKFTADGGTITLGIRQVGHQESKICIEFTVKDTGIGMSEEYRSRMFQPFEQENASTARKYGGTGLGLSISNNLVHMMGGQIEVASEQGKGTEFTIVLPFENAKTQKNLDEVPKDFSSLKILAVDDDTDTCNYMKELLGRMKIKCDIVNSGKKALRRVMSRKESGKQYDLCIIDWYMEDMDGMETAREVRKLCGKEVPIIIATAYDYTELMDEAKKAGVDKMVSKPLFQSTLFDLLVEINGKYKPVKNSTNKHMDFSGIKLILAEDNEMNMEIALDILNKEGFDITPVVNGKEALETFESSKPGTYDAILMDVQMPVMDGYMATRKIRECGHEQAKSIPIIAMTANAFSEDVTAALAAGMNDHVSKPISYDRLFDSLNNLVGEKKHHTQE